MKLLLLGHSLSAGGTERQIVNLAKALAERSVEVHLATFYQGGRLEQEVHSMSGVQFHPLRKSGLRDVVGFGRHLRRLIAERRFDVIYSFLPSPNIAALVARTLRKRPIIVWGMRLSPLNYRHYTSKIKWSGRVERWLFPLADHAVFNSQAALNEWLNDGLAKSKLTCIANGIETERYCLDPGARADVREELGLPESAKLIGLVGRIEPIKGHKTFLETAQLLSRRAPDVNYICVGGARPGMRPYAAELREYTARLGMAETVRWLGDRPDVARLMAAMDVLTSSSLGEGFPNAVAEGMACGTPCVVTDVGDSARIVGDIGKVIPPEDSSSLADAWVSFLALSHSERQELGRRSRCRVERLFSMERMAEETLALLARIQPRTV